ncbi:protein-glutamate methylesterase/protein-glutamine glutaminase [Roseburia sp. 499]|uniref:protein-glutamate methylesterase/protein-glutamine glutaminase n=1 Tax=Roseburia sp. 499 TaxID=1261634 RepID=UPI0009528389|nr:chemotaxis response regulator protein-glutamate methylesterase [Roseburia sp. 499]WVK69134.1 chemotaxis response regulator protein-glutamate methylesterase [Roseburia sp. 499]
MQKIKVLVVEDSYVFRELLVQNLNKDPAIQVVATAGDPYEARDAIVTYKPDVMTLDIELPRMSGIEFLRKLMPQYPMPVIVISALSDKVFDALGAGAVDFVAKPVVSDKQQIEEFVSKELPDKIKIAVKAHVSRVKHKNVVPRQPVQNNATKKNLIIAIGASTGGTEAIAAVLQEFGTDIPGVVVVQHMPAGFTEMFAGRLNDKCNVKVKEAKTGDVVLPGQVLIAPGGDAHMEIVRVNDTYQVICKRGAKVNGHCPSVDVLFQSVAKVARENAIGIILTGMGGDGAKGLLEMKNAGAKTIGQDESTCVVYGMPKVAYQLGAVEYQEQLPNIARRTYQILRNM